MNDAVRILVVDGAPHRLRAASRLLRQVGHEVLVAATGTAGLHLAKEARPDLILLDLLLPDMNGLELCRLIKAEPALTSTFVILISDLRIPSELQAGDLESGADGYIARPIANRELLGRVQAMVRVKQSQIQVRERAKELQCLYDIIALVEKPGITLDEILRDTVKLIPLAWQYPEITVARLVLEDQEFVAAGFQETSWSLTRDIVVNGEPLGCLQVCLLEARPERDEGPFLQEERDLLQAIAERLGRTVERLRVQAALEESERKYRDLVENINEVIYTLDLDGVLTYVSPSVESLLGFPPSEAIGHPWQEFVHSEDLARSGEALQATLSGQRAGSEYRAVTRSGDLRWVQTSSRPVVRDGRVVGIQGTLADVTERRRAEEALRASEARFRAQYEGIPIPTYTWQKCGDDVVLIDYNTAATAITRGAVRDFVGMRAAEMYRHRPDIVNDLSQCLAEKCSFHREMTYGFATTGETRHLMVMYAYVPPDLVVVHTEDFTERQRAEEHIQASLTEKELLLKEIHHRVKNNLQVISSLLDMQSLSMDSPAAIQALQDSRTRVRIIGYVHERLYQSKDLVSIDVPEFVASLTGYLLTVYESQASRTRLVRQVDRVSLDLDTAIPCGLIINELVSNALKHAFPPEGIEGCEIRVTISSLPGGELELVVGDNGVGLPEGIEPLTTRSLGLRLVAMLTQQLQGTLELDRSRGTVFTIKFAGGRLPADQQVERNE